MPFRAEWDRHSLTPQHTAYLRVAEGCSHACTFCAIPHWRQVIPSLNGREDGREGMRGFPSTVVPR